MSSNGAKTSRFKVSNVITRIESNGKKIVTFSDIHSDIHNLIVCLRDCAEVITGTLSQDELEIELCTHIDININHDHHNQLYCVKPNGDIYDPSLGFRWKKDCEKIVVLIGDLIDGKRVLNNEQCEHEYLQIEFKIYAFINALMHQGGDIYKILGNHEVMNIINPDPTYIFELDKFFPYTRINAQPVYRTDIFKIGQVGYNAIFYKKCYMLLQIDNNIFVHGQLVGENYTYYETINEVLNYDLSSDIKKYFSNPELTARIFKTWYSFLVLILYKCIYGKNLIKWIALHHHLKTNIDNIYPMVVKDVDAIIALHLDDPMFSQRNQVLNECLQTVNTNIAFLNTTFKENSSNKIELILKLKPEFDRMKHHIFSAYLNVDENELWKREYGFTTSLENFELCKTVDSHLEAYNKYMSPFGSNVKAERVIIGHCTQNSYTTNLNKANTSYNTVLQDLSGFTERLICPSKTAYSYYTNKNDNLIFGITMDCACKSNPNFHKLYRVDVGASRGFDVFSNYKTLFDEIDYLDFFETGYTGCQFGLILDENEPFVSVNNNTKTVELEIADNHIKPSETSNNIDIPDSIAINIDDVSDSTSIIIDDSDEDAEELTIEATKNGLIREFIKTFLSRIPQVLEIDKDQVIIIRATLKNIFVNQPRSVMKELSKNRHLMKVIEEGGHDFLK